MGVVSQFKLFRTAPILFAAMLLGGPAWAIDAAPAPPENPFRAAAEAAKDEPSNTHWDVYMSGYAYHDRATYTPRQIAKMNENTWGGGLGHTWRNKHGNDESVYVLGIRDSNNRPQWMAGYAHQWMFPIVAKKLEVGAGLTALLIRRHGWFNGNPFPAVLPVASIGTRNTQLLATYVPRVNSSKIKGKGDIVMVMLKMSL